MSLTTLEADLHLLDLLATLPEAPEHRPSREDLAARLTALCHEQRVPATPDQIHRAVETYLVQQTLDDQLIALIHAGPAEPMDPEALRQRLAQRCKDEHLPATPASIAQAIASHEAKTAPFTLWPRPRTEAERLAALKEHEQRQNEMDPVDMGFVMMGLGSFFLGGIVLITSMMFFPKEVGLVAGLAGAGIFGSIFLSLGYSIYRGGSYTPLASEPHARLITARRSARVAVKDLARLAAVQPNLDRMQAWLGNPKAAAALKQLSRSEVPITQQDAVFLDGYVHEAQQQRAKQAALEARQAWEQGLAQLRG